jgi:hypothetical protein
LKTKSRVFLSDYLVIFLVDMPLAPDLVTGIGLVGVT